MEYLQMRRLRMVVASRVEASSGVAASPLAAGATPGAPAAAELGGRPKAARRAASASAGRSMSRASCSALWKLVDVFILLPGVSGRAWVRYGVRARVRARARVRLREG